MAVSLKSLIGLSLVIGIGGAHAQSDSAKVVAEGAAPESRQVDGLQVYELHYRSALSGYKAWEDQPAEGWREANDLTGEIGGWRVYVREASRPEPASPGETTGMGRSGKDRSNGNPPASGVAGAMPDASPNSTPNSADHTGHEHDHGSKR